MTVGDPAVVDEGQLVDLFDPALWQQNPHDLWRSLRAEAPLVRDRENGVWAVLTHAGVQDVERRSEVFVSGQGYRRWFEPDENNMIAQDDPQHLAQRRLINRRFTPRAVKDDDAAMRAVIGELLDEAAARGEMEVVGDLAAQLPSRMTARMLGFPEERWPDVQSWSERLMRTDSRFVDQQVDLEFNTACLEFGMLLQDLIPERRGCPADDLLSVWSGAEHEGEPWGFDRIFNEVGLVIAGGAETTRTAIAHGLRTFVDHPEQWELLAEQPDLVPSAVEEVIRWVSPLNNFFRTAVADDEVCGVPVAEGDRFCLVYPAANRDPAVFAEPDRFDVTRSPNPHVAFGYGTHFCLGAAFARHELVLLFTELTRRFTNLRVTAEIDVEPNIFARAVRSLGVSFDPR
jgi:cytochrome P450 family 142 subfamily A polypeptide 1